MTTRNVLRASILTVSICCGMPLIGLAQSISTTVTETPGNYSQTSTVTGPNGKVATYQDNESWGNRSLTGNRSVTGFNGKTATASTTASYAPGSTSRQTTATGPNGQTGTYQDNRSWGNGAYSDTRSATGPNGAATDTRTRSGGVVTNKSTGRNGKSRTFSRPARFRR